MGPVEEVPSAPARQQRHERGQLHVRRWLRVSSTLRDGFGSAPREEVDSCQLHAREKVHTVVLAPREEIYGVVSAPRGEVDSCQLTQLRVGR